VGVFHGACDLSVASTVLSAADGSHSTTRETAIEE